MKLEKQDIIVAHMMTSAGVVAPIIGKLRKTPVVSRLTGFEMRMNPLYKSLILKPILKNSQAIITINSDMQKEIEKFIGKKVEVIPHGI